MVDQEVADILEEIREQVRAGQAAASPQPSSERADKSPSVPSELERGSQSTSIMSNSFSGLPVMARAWDRLPPLVSNRSGGVARFELWLKARLKRTMRWFTWEQVNFNAAAHQTFRDIIETLSDYEQQLVRTQTQLRERFEQQQAELNAQRSELSAQRTKLNAQHTELSAHRNELNAQHTELESQRTELNAQRIEFSAQRAELDARQTDFRSEFDGLREQVKKLQCELSTQLESHKSEAGAALADIRSQLAVIDAQRAEIQAQLSVFTTELRERDERLLDEQRVCFKQLSLEASESLVLQDRARREIESRLARLESTRE